jgi:hypothetical protein
MYRKIKQYISVWSKDSGTHWGFGTYVYHSDKGGPLCLKGRAMLLALMQCLEMP